MGNKYEVYSWVKDIFNIDGYKYVLVYHGKSLIKALIVMWKEKQAGSGCVKFYWR